MKCDRCGYEQEELFELYEAVVKEGYLPYVALCDSCEDDFSLNFMYVNKEQD